MTLQWHDFPSGQPGIYGFDENKMLDGTPWVAVVLGGTGAIVSDPDSATFPNGIVLLHSSGADGPEDAARLALPSPNAEVGMEMRFYVSELPSNASGRCIYTMNTTGNVARYNIVLMPNGSLRMYYGRDSLGPGTLLADSVSPVIFANSWTHLGFKSNVVTGEFEVRKNNAPIAALTDTHGSPPGGTIGIVGFPDRNPGSSSWNRFYTKDLVVWTAAGTEINDFQGTVSVRDLYPTADVTQGGWALSSGTLAYQLVDETTPNDADFVQSGLAPTAAIEFSFSDLPIDVTSVRAVTMIMRAFNSAAGDGEIQMTATPDGGTSNDAGLEHFLTSTPTYYWDHSELSPASGVAWTPTEVNNIQVSYNRTL